jgi:hypothetical protein
MDDALSFPLAGSLILGLAFVPWATEVILQLRLQARFLEALPPADRAALPPHPADPRVWFLGSPRFQHALWRSSRRDLPYDSPGLAGLKRRMRASLYRQIVWVGSFAATVAVLLGNGWRPVWP